MAADSAWIEFIRYNVWANQTLLQACEALSPEQLAASAPGTYGTIARTLEHLVDSEAHYYSLLAGRRLPPPLRWEDGPAVPDIRAYYAEVGEALVAVAGQVSPEAAVHQKWQEGK